MTNKILLLSTILLFSCGTRKINKSETKEETKTEIVDTSKIVTKADTNIKVIDKTDTDEQIIEPIDNSMPILVNGKTYKNVRLRSKKTKNDITTEKVEKVAKIEKKSITTKSNSKKSVEVKQIDKKQLNFLSLWWLWLLIIILVYVGYKEKDKLFL